MGKRSLSVLNSLQSIFFSVAQATIVHGSSGGGAATRRRTWRYVELLEAPIDLPVVAGMQIGQDIQEALVTDPASILRVEMLEDEPNRALKCGRDRGREVQKSEHRIISSL
jgi:hypothetical protein